MENDTLVGYLVNGNFLCVPCTDVCWSVSDRYRVAVFEANIAPYSQACTACGDMVVQGQTAVMLFE